MMKYLNDNVLRHHGTVIWVLRRRAGTGVYRSENKFNFGKNQEHVVIVPKSLVYLADVGNEVVPVAKGHFEDEVVNYRHQSNDIDQSRALEVNVSMDLFEQVLICPFARLFGLAAP